MNLMKLLSDSVSLQIVQHLQNCEEATTKQISEALGNVPTPTLYRHINSLLKEEVLLIKEERKVRGSLERVLIINKEKFYELENGDIAGVAYHFLMTIYDKFVKYSMKEEQNPLQDKLSMRTCMLSLEDEEFDEFMQDIAGVISKYEIKSGQENAKLRRIAFISAPVEEEDQ